MTSLHIVIPVVVFEAGEAKFAAAYILSVDLSVPCHAVSMLRDDSLRYSAFL